MRIEREKEMNLSTVYDEELGAYLPTESEMGRKLRESSQDIIQYVGYLEAQLTKLKKEE